MERKKGELREIPKVSERDYQNAVLGLRTYSVSMALYPEMSPNLEFSRQIKRLDNANTMFWYEVQQDEAEFRKRRGR